MGRGHSKLDEGDNMNNPFRQTVTVERLQIIVEPSGGDDAAHIQEAIDQIDKGEGEWVFSRRIRRWRWPWHPPTKTIQLSEGGYVLMQGDYILEHGIRIQEASNITITGCYLRDFDIP